MSIEMGMSQSRLMRRIEANLEDPIVSNLKGTGGAAPGFLDTSAIVPTWDINQSGMLDPKDKEREQASSSPVFTNARFTQGAMIAGFPAGQAGANWVYVGPQGAAIPGTAIASINDTRANTRQQNTKLFGVYLYLQFDAAGALAFAGKEVSFSLFHKIAESVSWADFSIRFSREVVTIGTPVVYTFYWYSQQGILIPWDCLCYGELVSVDGTNFPNNTEVYTYATMYVRGKNSMLPQW